MNENRPKLALGMQVAVRRGRAQYAGVIVRFDGEHVLVRRTQTKGDEAPELYAHEDDVMPLPKGGAAKW